MNAFIDLILKFWALFVWGFVVAPWERALRVRLGGKTEARVVEFGPGLHFRVPYADVIYRQPVRLQYVSLDPQTVTTTDGQTITYAGVLGFEIDDLRTLYQRLQNVETTLQAIAHGDVAQYIATHPVEECQPDVVEQAVVNDMDLGQYGLKNPTFSLTTYARVKTYRIISDEHAVYSAAPYLANAEHSAARSAT